MQGACVWERVWEQTTNKKNEMEIISEKKLYNNLRQRAGTLEACACTV